MAATAYCSSCERTVYVEIGHEMFCPVCATPVAEVAESEVEEPEPAEAPAS
ncbi:MAG: hypothetical protein M3285_05150 [Actinomycetota bacterium]|nr:hypothetical protein [Actinomycetota bacterium]